MNIYTRELLTLLSITLAFNGATHADSSTVDNLDNGHFYQRIDSPMSWTSAAEYCKNQGGYLATLTSEQENSFVYDELQKPSNDFCWLGGSDSKQEGIWEWTNGDNWSYESWANGEPNGGTTENHLLYWGQYVWNDGTNSVVSHCGICEWDNATYLKANVANGKTVAAIGEFFTGGWGSGSVVDYSTITDGVVFPNWHQWDQGTVWWQENKDNVQNKLIVYLGSIQNIKTIFIQVDNNDDYLISWEDSNDGLVKKKVIPQRNWGMAPIVRIDVDAITDTFTIEHDSNGAGDGFYSVSEFAAIAAD
ncbi:MAG: C-type lectin domain-containing protein [Gammaproteobacteria bacterium]|nr:C-type lectin domain-containing protein [Gammaproteobacteria bacterium]